MFFHLASDKGMNLTAYLSDRNEELIKTYKVVKNNIEELIEVLTGHHNLACMYVCMYDDYQYVCMNSLLL